MQLRLLAASAGAVICAGIWLYMRRPRCVRKTVRPLRSFAEGSIESLTGQCLPWQFCVSFALKYEAMLDPERIAFALAKTLDVFPCVAGRLDPSSLLDGIPQISAFNSGVAFEVVDDHVDDISQMPLSSSSWSRIFGMSNHGIEYPNEHTPLLTVRLARFHRCGISFLHFKIHHLVGDVTSYKHFLSVWSHFSAFPDEPLPTSLHPLPANSRRKRVTKLPGYTAAEAKQALDLKVPDGLLWKLLRQMLSGDRVLELRVKAQKVKALKNSLMEKMAKGEWASTFEVTAGSFFAAKAKAATESGQRPAAFSNLKVLVNLREKVAEDKAAFPRAYFGNAFSWLDLDLTRAFDDVAEADSRRAVLGAVRTLHSQMRSGMGDGQSLCRDWLLLEAAQDLPASEAAPLFRRHLESLLGAYVDGSVMSLNEWASADLLSLEFGGRSACGFINDPVAMTLRNCYLIAPLDQTGDLMLSCRMPKAEAAVLLRVVKDWGLPFEPL